MDHPEKARTAELIDLWKRRTGIPQAAVCERMSGLIDDAMFSRYYKDRRRPLHKNPDHGIVVIATYSQGADPQHRCRAEEAIEFANLINLPPSRFSELEALFPADEWADAIARIPAPRSADGYNAYRAASTPNLLSPEKDVSELLDELRRTQRYLEEMRVATIEAREQESNRSRLFGELLARGVARSTIAEVTMPPSRSYHVPEQTEVYVERDIAESVLQSLERRSFLVTTIVGPGGSGKSTLAINIAHTCHNQRRFEQIIWTTAQKRRLPQSARNSPAFFEFEEFLDDILRAFAYDDLLDYTAPAKQRLAYECLSEATTLLIVDNLETIREYQPFEDFFGILPPGTRVLTTSRKRHPNSGELSFPLPPMTRQEAMALVERFAAIKGLSVTSRQMNALANELGGNPLAIVLTLGLLSTSENHGDAFLDRLSMNGSRRPVSTDDDERRLLHFLFEEAFRAVSHDAKDMLQTVGIFPVSIAEDELRAICLRDNNWTSLQHTLEELDSHSLIIYPQPGHVAVLPLTRKYLLRQLRGDNGVQFIKDVLSRYAHLVADKTKHRRICVFTPDFLPKFLPPDSTPLDFAYCVHTELGHRYAGAKVDGTLVSQEFVLQGGEIVEIIPSDTNSTPSQEWLDIVKSNRARQSIELFFARPKESDKAVNRGDAHCRRFNLTEAAAQYERALTLNPRNVRAHTRLGHVWRLQGKVSLAHRKYRDADIRQPNDVHVLVGRACLRYQVGDINGARGARWYYEQACLLRPEYVNALWGMARCFCRTHEYYSAVDYLDRAIRQPVSSRRKASLLFFRALARFGICSQEHGDNALKAANDDLEVSWKTFRSILKARSFLFIPAHGIYTQAYYAMLLACLGSSSAYQRYWEPIVAINNCSGVAGELLADLSIITLDMVSYFPRNDSSGDAVTCLSGLRERLIALRESSRSTE